MKNKLSLILSLFLIGYSQTSLAQGTIEPEIKSTQIRAMVLCPGISVEQKLGDQLTINMYAGLQPGLSSYTVEPDGTRFEFYVAPFVDGEIRAYYNRKKSKKELGPNSGNYFALAAGYNMKRIINDSGKDYYDESIENSYFVGPVWGIQRNYLNGFHLNISVGLGYQQGDYVEGGITMISSGGIGFYF